MTQPRQGRPPQPLDADASHAARLGAEIRSRRQDRGLTLKALAALIGFSLQHLSEVELAKAPVSGAFVAACDRALDARGTLSALLPAVVCERALQRHDRSTARHRSAGEVPVDAEWEARARSSGLARYAERQHPSEAEEDVDPLNRRSLLGEGLGAALGLGTPLATITRASAREIDPELVPHWDRLMSVLARHDHMFGAHDVLAPVRHQLDLIAQHRRVAGGELHTQLLRAESRWSQFAGWLHHEARDWQTADSCADHALRLAQEADWQDMVAYVLMRQSRWASMRHDARRATTLAVAAGRVPGTSNQIRALCALKEAHGHALGSDTASCQRSLAHAHDVLNRPETAEAPDLGRQEVTPAYVLAADARCWLWLRPRKAIAMFEDVLRLWPHDHTRGRGLQQAYLALACAAADEPERAAAEGVKALSIAHATKSDVTMRELKRLDHELGASDTPAAADFREAFAAV